MRHTLIILLFTTTPAIAGLVSSSSVGSVDATIGGATASDSSTNSSDTIGVQATENNSLTDADLNWAFTSSTNSVSFSGSVLEEKTIPARPGGDHLGVVVFEYDFTIDTIMDFSLNGSYGFDLGASPTSGTDDLAIYTLDGAGGNIVNGSIASGPTVAYSEVGALLPGSYTLVFSLSLSETINNADSRGAEFDGVFTLSEVTTVPEPASLSLLVIGMFAGLCHRRRRRPIRF